MAASVLPLLLSSDNLLAGWEQLRFNSFIQIYQSVFSEQNIDSCCIKRSIKIYQLVFYKQIISILK